MRSKKPEPPRLAHRFKPQSRNKRERPIPRFRVTGQAGWEIASIHRHTRIKKCARDVAYDRSCSRRQLTRNSYTLGTSWRGAANPRMRKAWASVAVLSSRAVFSSAQPIATSRLDLDPEPRNWARALVLVVSRAFCRDTSGIIRQSGFGLRHLAVCDGPAFVRIRLECMTGSTRYNCR